MIAVLDPCDRRADVFRDCRNRHVHHRTVQRHEELCRSKRQQYKSRAFSGNLLWLLLGYHGLLSFVRSLPFSDREKYAALFFLIFHVRLRPCYQVTSPFG